MFMTDIKFQPHKQICFLCDFFLYRISKKKIMIVISHGMWINRFLFTHIIEFSLQNNFPDSIIQQALDMLEQMSRGLIVPMWSRSFRFMCFKCYVIITNNIVKYFDF